MITNEKALSLRNELMFVNNKYIVNFIAFHLKHPNL